MLPVQSSLDSSLKKNTAFIKRLRTSITAATAATCLQEIRTLSLHKYLSEIISASYEGLCKLKTPAEIAAGVEIVSGLHQRFGSAEYTSYLGWLLGRGLSTPDKSLLKTLSLEAKEKEEKERLTRQRVLLRVVTELWLVGLLRSLEDVVRPEDAAVRGKDTPGPTVKEAAKVKAASSAPKNIDTEAFPLEVLKDLLGHDREHVNLPLVVIFVKSFAWDVLGAKPSSEKGRQTVDGDGTTTATADSEVPASADDGATSTDSANDPPLTGSELRRRFKGVLERYLEDVKAHLVRDQKAIAAQGKKNAEAYVKSGEVFEDRQANFDRQLKAQEKFVANTQILCDVLDSEMPDLSEKDPSDVTSGSGIGLIKTGEYLRGQGDGAGIWEDEEERRFYENLVDLRDRVPMVLLEEPKKRKTDTDEQVGKRNDAVTVESKDRPEKPPSPDGSAEDQSTAIANKTVGAQVDTLLARLPEFQSKDAVDQAAIDFGFLNSKASRNRLIKAVQDVPKGRSDLLPLYSRLVATLAKYLPDISQGLVTYLNDEFRSLQRRKSKEFLGQVRLGNIRYLAELTKFGVVPEHVIFHCLKVCLDDFSRMNIEIIANLLENCGRYLLRNPDTSPRMRSFLETLQRKKAAHRLGQQERMLVENAMYYVNPPERAAIQQKERTPVDLYVRKLVYMDLNKRTYSRVLKSIRKLHWEETEVVAILRKVFSKPGKLKYNSIHLLAVLLSGLFRYHQDFFISILDSLLEQVTLGLEQNDFKFNQRRIAEVKYLGELYNYKMVDSPIIFDTMYRLATFGHAGGTPIPGRFAPLDPPDDFFRIRLIANILETCGTCFDRGAAKKKLDFFLTFFQYYIKTKDQPPMDIDFVIQDAFALVRPQWKIATDLEEASRLFAEACQQTYKSDETEKQAEPDEAEEEASSDEGDAADIPAREGEEGQSSSEEADAGAPSSDEAKHDSDFDEEIVVKRQEEERDPEAEAEFDRELAKMMSESIDSRKLDRKPVFDVPLPMRRPLKDSTNTADDTNSPGTVAPSNKMAFALMTKKGSKQQVRIVSFTLSV